MPAAKVHDKKHVTFMSRKRETLGPPRTAGWYWKAGSYRLGTAFDRSEPEQELAWRKIEAGPDASWTRVNPFGYYRPASGVFREVEPGPHADFLTLARLVRNENPLADKMFQVFATNYGLLGLFWRHYAEYPVLQEPRHQVIAPEAVIDNRGKLHRIDPASEGTALLTADEDGFRWLTESDREWYTPVRDKGTIALPSEVAFPQIGSGEAVYPLSAPARELVPWERAREQFGGLLVYDGRSPTRTSVLCTSEPLNLWRYQLASFPPGSRKAAAPELEEALRQLRRDYPDEPEDTLRAELEVHFDARLLEVLRTELAGTQPYPVPGDDGQLRQGWLTRNLHQAMHLMVYLDIDSGWEMRKCQAPVCPRYYRAPKHDHRSKYCPPPPGKEQSACASRASSAMYRERQRRES